MGFKVGDVVKLKSGGPHMTVEKLEPDGGITCTWFNGLVDSTRSYPESAIGIVEPRAQNLEKEFLF